LVESMRSFVSFRTPPTVFQVLMESADRLEHYHNEVSSVLELLDGLADEEISQVISGLYCIADGGTPFAVDEGVNCIRKHVDVMLRCWARLRVLVK